MKNFFLFFMLINLSFALGTVQHDSNYQIAKEEGVDVIFPKEYAKEASIITEYLSEIFKEYDKSFAHQLTNKPTLSLLSHNNQVTNATATVIPNTIMTWYGAGAHGIDYFNSPSWGKTLGIHESAHLYQLDAKSEPSKTMEKIFGTPMFPIFAWWLPFFVAPNVLLPDLFLEGNAVFNESRFGVGGRLYGGRHRALFFSLFRGGKLGYKRLLNNHNEFPFLEEKYIVGGYFFAYLAQEYGVDKVNSFFKNHSSLYVNPLDLSKTTEKLFNKSYKKLIYDFLVSWRDEAKRFKVTNGEVIGKTLVDSPFGEGVDEFYFLVNNLEDYPSVYTLKKNGTLEVVQGDFLTGKPFKVDNKIFTVATTIVDKYKLAYSLFDKNREELKKFRGKIVQDIHGEKTLYFRGDKFASSDLYLDDKNLGEIHSSSMFDSGGNYYYFKQNKKRRELYKNRKKLLTFKGFDSKIVDIKDDRVYFTAPSEYGNALYMFKTSKKRRLSRIGFGDDIIDAKNISEDMFLLKTITSEGYEYKLSVLKENRDYPKVWKYSFSDSKSLKDVLKTQDLKDENYNHVIDMKFNSLYPSFSFGDNGTYKAMFTASFSDPLQQNNLSLKYIKDVQKYDNGTDRDESIAFVNYTNKRYLTTFGFSFANYTGEVLAPHESKYFASGFVNYPFVLNSRERLDVTLLKYLEKDYRNHKPIITTARYMKDIRFEKSFFSKEYIQGEIFNRMNREQKTNGFHINYGRSFYNSFFIEGDGKYSTSNKTVIKIDKASSLVTDIADFTLLDPAFRYFSDEVYSYKLQGKVAIDKSRYFGVFPFSLQDLTLFAYEESTVFDVNGNSLTVTEDVFGSDINILAFHRFLVPVRVMYVINSEAKEKGTFFFSLSNSF